MVVLFPGVEVEVVFAVIVFPGGEAAVVFPGVEAVVVSLPWRALVGVGVLALPLLTRS